MMLALETKIRFQSASARLRRVLAWVSDKIDDCVIAERIATPRYGETPNDVAEPRGKSGRRRRVDPDALAQAEGDIVEGRSSTMQATSRQMKLYGPSDARL